MLLDSAIEVIAAKLRDGAVSAMALAEEVVERYEATESRLRTYKTFEPQLVLDQAAAADATLRLGQDFGPLHGVPVSVKDIFGVRGYPTFAGTPRRLPPEWEEDAAVLRRVRRQMAVVSGKTHTVEFAYGGYGTNRHWGAPRNPWDAAVHRIPGGSSSGAGVSLSQGTCVLALGTDTGGSVRIPAAVTGAVGIKTSVGRWPMGGVVPLSQTLDTVGILARSVADAAYGFGAIDGRHGHLRALLTRIGHRDPSGVTLGVCQNFMWDECSPGVDEAVLRALTEFEEAGARVKEIAFPELDKCFELYRDGSVVSAEFDANISEHFPEWRASLDPDVSRRAEAGKNITAGEYLLRKRAIERFGEIARARLEGVDALAVPTVALTPPTLEELADRSVYARLAPRIYRNTCVANIMRACAVTMPVGLDRAGLPVGLQLLAPFMADERLLGLALSLERVLGTPRERIGVPPKAPS